MMIFFILYCTCILTLLQRYSKFGHKKVFVRPLPAMRMRGTYILTHQMGEGHCHHRVKKHSCLNIDYGLPPSVAQYCVWFTEIEVHSIDQGVDQFSAYRIFGYIYLEEKVSREQPNFILTVYHHVLQ
ncbi:hypothetical protein BDV06DRAFT_168838 [Aspergillus oleicola]